MANPLHPNNPAAPEQVTGSRRALASDAQARAGGHPSLEGALRALLGLGSVSDTEKRVVRVVRELTGATWTAFLRKSSSHYVCCAVEGPGPVAGDVAPALPEAPRGVSGRPRVLHLADADAAGWSGARLMASLPLVEGSPVLLVLGGTVAPDDAAANLDRLLEPCAVALQNAQLLDQLRSQVFVDALTGCYNRRGFDDHLRTEVVRAQRYRRPLSLMMMDLDRFKEVNDELGHPAGDHVLRCVGATLLGSFRTTDVVCRYGGDEFGIIFPETSKEEVVRLAERLRARLENLFPDERISTVITGSVGVAAFPVDAADGGDLVSKADRALYRAKEEGKNRVVVAPGL